MRCSASDSEAVHRWSGTVAKAVCVTVPGLQRIIPLRSMLRSARDTLLLFRGSKRADQAYPDRSFPQLRARSLMRCRDIIDGETTHM
jgi:hypothetical protein